VLYRPPVQKNTYLLWLAPLILLLTGAWILRINIRKRSALLDADENEEPKA
jgi:cytochrome c-type biogenesis protein CcmH